MPRLCGELASSGEGGGAATALRHAMPPALPERTQAEPSHWLSQAGVSSAKMRFLFPVSFTPPWRCFKRPGINSCFDIKPAVAIRSRQNGTLLDAQSESSRVEWKGVGVHPPPAPSSAPVSLPARNPPPLVDPLAADCSYLLRVKCRSSVSGTERDSLSLSNPKTSHTQTTMKRNFGSLNLAALDLNSPFHTGADSAESILADRFSAMNPSSEDCSMDDSEYSNDENVGYPLERMDLPPVDMHSAPQSLLDDGPGDMDMEDAMPELTLPARASRPHSENGDVRATRLMHPAATEIPKHLHDQHNVELNALRCLSLKVMLSNLSTPTNGHGSGNASVTSSKPATYAYPGVNDRAKTALLPIRQPSLQSV
ncbi:hypothetical protein V7S43_010991 [Phytophthora oleae]|uniref:Uncharacterized protein n=1 Tax=Phytophthora oleae TaxID=2107226 RepID=A0ABD3FCF9_9STRA